MQFQSIVPKFFAASRFALALIVAPFWLLSSTPARAVNDCVPFSGVALPGDTVVCSGTVTDQDAPNGYGTGVETGLTINVLSGATVTGTNDGISVNTNNVINNSGTVTGGDNGVNIGSGTVINNAGATISGTGLLGVGVSMGDGVVVNSGTISGLIRGISVVGTATITNFGTVTATGGLVPGLGIDLNNGTLNNFGTVESTGIVGVAVTSNTNLTVNNAGTIRANGDFGTAINANGAVANINNSGSVVANGDTGVAINVAFGAVASINNSGNIAANGPSGTGINVAFGAVASIVNSGTISATGIGGAGILVQPGSLASIANRGTITGDTGVVLGPGAGATLANAGKIVGTGGIAIDSFGGNALIFQPGSRVIGQINVGAGDTATVQTGRDISSLLTFCVCGGVSFSVTGGAPFAINGTQIAVLDPTAYALADRSLTDFTGMLSSLITGRFNGTGAAPPPVNAASAFVPSLNGIAAMAEPAFAGIAGLAYARDNGTSSIPNATFEDRYSGISVWSQGFVGGRRQQADGPTLPATSVAYGGALGLEKNVGRDLRLGVFAGAGQGKLKVDLDSQTIETDYVFAGVYGRIYRGAQFIDFIVTGGATSNDSRRLVANNLAAGGLETATASYNGWFVSPEIAYGVHIPLAANSTVTPAARLRYAVGHNSGYSETGSAQNLSVGDRTFQNLEGRLEMALARFDEITARGWLKTTVTLGGLAMQRLGGQTVNTVLIGQNLLFSAPGDDTVGGAYMGWGLDYLTPHGFGLFVAAEGSAMTDHSIFGTARGGVRVYF